MSEKLKLSREERELICEARSPDHSSAEAIQRATQGARLQITDAKLISTCKRFTEAYRIWAEIIDLPWDDEETEAAGKPLYDAWMMMLPEIVATQAVTREGLSAKLDAVGLYCAGIFSPKDLKDKQYPDRCLLSSLCRDTATILRAEHDGGRSAAL
ncbi:MULTISPECIES: hypothetical protein [Gluconobacter]|uniref:hypothetical protein n=1 Tax=Gluconobacter TaxID=441 RepID=UPI0039EC2B8F